MPGWLRANGREVKVFQERDPAALPWGELGVDVVVECTGAFRDREGLGRHLAAGARRVVLSAPARRAEEVDLTLCLGVNDELLDPERHLLVSNVPGPTEALYLRGSLVERMYPVSTLPPGLRLNITMFSYNGKLNFGLVSTHDLEDLQSLADGIVTEFDRLEEAIIDRY